MSEPAPPTPEIPEPVLQADPCFHLEPLALAGLEAHAKAHGISSIVALHQLLEAGARHLKQEDAHPSQKLSEKQAAVLKSLQAGHSVKNIAGKLSVSEGTIRTHIHRMRSRLNRSDLLSLRFQ